MSQKNQFEKNPQQKIPDKIILGRDKLNDPIELQLKRPAVKGEEVKWDKLSYDELTYHLKSKCPNMIIKCNSCDLSLPRNEFFQHTCHINLKELEQAVLVMQKAQVLQIFLEIQKVNKHGVDLFKCFSTYAKFAVTPCAKEGDENKERDPQSKNDVARLVLRKSEVELDSD